MGIRTIRDMGDDILRKHSKPIKEMTPRIRQLIADMFETMYDDNGVGLAAPQVGILKRLFVIDCGDPETLEPRPYVFINPEILETRGEVTDSEGCLSIPGRFAPVPRPEWVKVRALDKDMKEFTLEAEGLLARCICHENDHLDGILYVDKATGPVEYVKEE